MTTTAFLKKHRVLILINVRWWNATAFYAINIARLLRKHGHQVWVGCDPAYPAYRMARACGLRVAPLAFYGSNPFKLLRSFRMMLGLIRREGIEIINTHRSEDHTFGLLAKAICGTRLVITRGDQRKIKANGLSHMRYRLADAVILTCRQILADNQRVFEGLAERVSVIYGSVDEDHFKACRTARETAEKYGLPPGKTIVGMVGRLSHVKDQSLFVNAAIALAQTRSDLHFVVAGKEVDLTHGALKRRADRAGVGTSFTFLAEVDDIADVIQMLDIGVIASVASETISRVLLEYMLLGKPVVATRINAMGEIVIPGRTGELIAPKDGPALVRAMFKLADDARMRRGYARRAAEVYANTYSESEFYRRYMRVFSGLPPVSGHGRRDK